MPELPAVREALSWHIAAAFARRHPETKVQRSLRPEGVGYDTLVLHTKDSQLALLNRGGRAHVGEESIEWEGVAEVGIHTIVERIEAANGMPFAGKRPPTSPRVLTYRAISRLLNDAVFGISGPLREHDGAGLEVEPCHWDDTPAEWLSCFPALERRIAQAPCPHHFWHVKAPDTSIGFDARTGEAWSRGGEHLDLPREYSSAGRKMDAFMEEVRRLARTPERQPGSALDRTAAASVAHAPVTADPTLFASADWGPHEEGERTPFEYRVSYERGFSNRVLFEDPNFRLDLMTLLLHASPVFSITFSGTGGTPVWICGARSRGRLALETGYGSPGELQKPKRGGVGQLLTLGWKAPADAEFGGFTAVLSDRDAHKAVSLILGTLQSSAYGDLHTIWWIWPPNLADVVAGAQQSRQRSEGEALLSTDSGELGLGQTADVGPADAPVEAPASGALDLTTAAWQERVGQIETVLSFFGQSFTIDVKRVDGVPVYVQGRRGAGTSAIEVEAVSNEFLPNQARLAPAQIEAMEKLGWDPPSGQGSPNFRLTVYDPSEETVHTLATVIGATLGQVYGVQSDDEWSVTPAEFGMTVGDIVDPGLFDIFGEGIWFNWAWKSASQYARLSRAAHEVMLFVLGNGNRHVHSGPYRDGSTGAMGLPHVAGADLLLADGSVIARATTDAFAVRLPADWTSQLAAVPDATRGPEGTAFGISAPGFVQVDFPLPDESDAAAASTWIVAVRDLSLRAVLDANMGN